MDPPENQKRRRSNDASDILRDPSISPPPKRRALPSARDPGKDGDKTLAAAPEAKLAKKAKYKAEDESSKTIPSPIQLNFIQELPASSNVDTVSLGNILGDPMIKECWLFNYLFDVDFVMCDTRFERWGLANKRRNHFDPDTRDIVRVKVVHGSWKNEDTNRIAIEVCCRPGTTSANLVELNGP